MLFLFKAFTSSCLRESKYFTSTRNIRKIMSKDLRNGSGEGRKRKFNPFESGGRGGGSRRGSGGRGSFGGNASRGRRGSSRGRGGHRQNSDHYHQNRQHGGRGEDSNKTQDSKDFLSKLKETEVGIECYVHDSKPVFGILKQRYTDFQVNEIDRNGNIVKLDQFLDQTIKEEKQLEDEKMQNLNENVNDESVLPKTEEELKEEGIQGIAPLLQPEEVNQLRLMLELPTTTTHETSIPAADGTSSKVEQSSISSSPSPITKKEEKESTELSGVTVVPEVLVLKPEADKVIRGQQHASIRKYLGTWIESDTLKNNAADENNKTPKVNSSSVRLIRRSGANVQKILSTGIFGKGGGAKRGGRSQQRQGGGGKEPWPEGRPLYTRFVLSKENKETNAVVSILSKYLSCKPNSFSFAGTKDKRGVTVQHFAGYKLSRSQLARAASQVSRLGIYLGATEYVDHPLGLGDTCGNHFKVTLRNVSFDGVIPSCGTKAMAEVNDILEKWKTQGFMNYFGLQRFGTQAQGTHTIGKALLQSDWTLAVNLILGDRLKGVKLSDVDAVRAVLYETPSYLVAETALLKGFMYGNHPASDGDHTSSKSLCCKEAISRIPRNLRKMYVHAYQSIVWNCMASQRRRLYGVHEAVEGDLVQVVEQVEEEESASTSSTSDIKTIPQETKDDDVVKEKTKEVFKRKKKVVHVVTGEDVVAKKYSVYDVVLPVPGYEIEYPTHQVGFTEYQKYLANDGIDITKLKHEVPEFALTGDYRKFLQRPGDATWQWHRYKDSCDQLTPTESDILKEKYFGSSRKEDEERGNQQSKSSQQPQQLLSLPCESTTTRDEAPTTSVEVKETTYAGLTLCFSLKPSTYATMCLREVLKLGTNQSGQASLNELKPGETPLPDNTHKNVTTTSSTTCSTMVPPESKVMKLSHEEPTNNTSNTMMEDDATCNKDVTMEDTTKE